MRALRLPLFATGLVLLTALPARPLDFRVDDRVVFVQRHQGIPIHDQPRGTDDHRRVMGGLTARVLEVAGLDGRWLRVEVASDPGDDREDWVHRKYVARVLDRDEPSTGNADPMVADDHDDERAVFSSPEACLEVVVGEGRRMAGTVPDAVRVGSWNIRWFPDGCPPGASCDDEPTDVVWLACAIAWMDLDVVAVQEILGTDAAAEQLRELVDQLDTLTGGAWHSDVQACGAPDRQRVGFLWNRQRIILEGHADLWQLNGAAEDGSDPCAGDLRPGRYARARVEDGADFQLVSVHLDSGVRQKDFENRRRSTGRLAALTVGGASIFARDRDVLVVGDFNSMGASELGITDEAERATLAAEVAPTYRRIGGTPACSHYFRGDAGTLDHVLASAEMLEAEADVRVTGTCALEACGSLGDRRPAAFTALSDHCPLVVELRNADLDPSPLVDAGATPILFPQPDLDVYYAQVDAGSADALRRTLHARIRDHTVFPYSHSSKTDTWDILEQADADPLDPGRVLDVYLNASYRRVGRGNDDYNREHTWPKGYGFRSRDDPPHTDCHHLFLSNIGYNQDRDRALFDDCDAGCFRYATRSNAGVGGNHGPFPDDDNWLLRRDNQSAAWQVWSARQGDVARAMLYMDVRYEGGVHAERNRREPDLVLLDDLATGSSFIRGDGTVESRMGDLCTLLAWHRADPPDDRERQRNDVVYRYQGNRNPFIDRPDWAERLFADRCGP